MHPQENTTAPDLISRFRRFNRFYTNLLGLLRRRLHDSPLNLAEARTLFEIRESPGISAARLSRMLRMDRSQLSRILARLHKQRLIERETRPAGRRAVPLHASARGLDLLAQVDAAANGHAAALLGHLDADAARRLDSALEEVTELLTTGHDKDTQFQLRTARSGDMAWIIDRHAALYGGDHGFDADFERYVLLGLAAYAQLPDPDRSALFLAERHGRRLGSVGIVEAGEGMAQLRWLLVTPEARGLGVGRALVERACAFATAQGYKGVFVWTLDDLIPARTLYASFGFELTESRPGTMGGRPVVEERWERLSV